MGQGFESLQARHVVGIAQLVRAPDCGSGGREFESLYSPHIQGCRQAVRHETLTFALAGPNPATPAKVKRLGSIRYLLSEFNSGVSPSGKALDSDSSTP